MCMSRNPKYAYQALFFFPSSVSILFEVTVIVPFGQLFMQMPQPCKRARYFHRAACKAPSANGRIFSTFPDSGSHGYLLPKPSRYLQPPINEPNAVICWKSILS